MGLVVKRGRMEAELAECNCFGRMELRNSDTHPSGSILATKPTSTSSGAPRTNPNTESIPIDDAIAEEFMTLRKQQRLIYSETTFEAAMSGSNRWKNRYTDILAADHSRVKIRQKIPTVGSDYINANWIKLPCGESNLEYISCQAPLPDTFGDFWQMVYEHNCPVIVTLTELVDGTKVFAHSYWPTVEGATVHFGCFRVTLKSQKDLGAFWIRSLELDFKSFNGEYHCGRRVIQLHFKKWCDRAIPDNSDGILYLAKVASFCRERGKLANLSGPMVVHCSAGVGRAGTFVAIAAAMQLTLAGEEVHLPTLVQRMRRQRPGMVQTLQQYAFIYRTLQQWKEHAQVGLPPAKRSIRIST